jgi:uncharacterized protein YcbX
MTYKISQLNIFPVKGMAGISVEQALARPIGFAYDRRWMLIRKDNMFLSQREFPILAQFKTNIEGDLINIAYQSQKVSFGATEVASNEIFAKVWDDTAVTNEVNPSVSKILSNWLSMDVKLVRLANEDSRLHHVSTRNIEIHASLADGYPYLLIGTASLDHLNQKLSKSISMDRFRPNIVIETEAPHIEDSFRTFMSNDKTVIFENIKPCARCQVITIDQSNSSINNEPLKVLSTYRKAENKVFFGTNVICLQPGMIKVGDQLIPS